MGVGFLHESGLQTGCRNGIHLLSAVGIQHCQLLSCIYHLGLEIYNHLLERFLNAPRAGP
jgi:hypothetical protein